MAHEVTADLLHAWRHPRAQGAEGRCIGRTDLPVDPRRAKRLAHRVRAWARRHGLPRVVVTSPLQRGRAVGAWLARWGWRHRVDPALGELDFGRWDGQPWADVPQAEIDAWCADFARHAPGGGEPLPALLQRVRRFDPADARLLVTHGGWLSAAQWLHEHGPAAPAAERWPAAPGHGRRVALPCPAGFTLASERRDFPDWHRGRPHFAVWALALEAEPAVAARLAVLRQALQGLLLPGDERQPHLTLHVCGFPADPPQAADEFGRAQLQAQAQALQRAGVAPFTLALGAAFSFLSAAGLSVGAGSGALQRLRHACRAAAAGFDGTPWVPHVTAGLYGGAWPLAEVQARLQPLAALPPVAVHIAAVDWMCYDSAQVGGPLRSVLRLDLATRQLQVLDEDFAARCFSRPAALPTLR